ncbi:allene oxide cyclase barrel-like domain-containing protein [Streptomyces sp. NPDC055092]
MMRPIGAACLGTATLVTLLACTPVAAAATDTGSAQARGKARIITLQAEVQQLTRFPVTPVTPGSVKQGDQVVVRSDLFDEAHNKVGETHGACTTTRGGDPALIDEAEQCVVTYTLPGGQLTVQGMYFNYVDQGPFDNAITGGTGKYEKARGSVHADTIATDPKVVRRFTIHLV